MNECDILVRADGSARMGMGHVARMLTLGCAAKRAGYEVAFAVHHSCELAQAILQKTEFATHAVAAHAGGDADATETLALAARCRASLLVVDGYQFDAPYFRAVSARRLLTCQVDDLLSDVSECDVVLNGNVFARRSLYPESTQSFLVGPSFALVGDPFLKARRPWRPRPARNLVVTFGGSDPTDESRKVLRAIERVDLALSVRIIVGPAYQQPSLQELATRSRHDTKLIVATGEMASQMAWADVAVTAGGGTCLEIACVGVPSLVIVAAENQRPVAEALDNLGLMQSLGWHETVTSDDIAHALTTLCRDPTRRSQMVDAQHGLIDGRGPERAVAGFRVIVPTRA